MTEDRLVDLIFEKEGDTYGDQHTRPPIDQPTARGGLTLPVVNKYCQTHGQPAATLETLRTMSHETARQIVLWKTREISREHRFDALAFEPLRVQMIDFAYNSGEALAVRWLQRVLRVPRSGTMDAGTIAALEGKDLWLVNQALVGARLEMVDRWTDADAKAKMWEEGVESRGLEFSLLEVP
jgi:lysozyme family protein